MGPATEPPGMTAARLRVIAVTLGLAWMLLFVLIGVAFRLQFYGDGSAFSYGVALGENWAMHWHNLVTRIAVYLLCLAPAEGVARLSQSAVAGTTAYALLFFGAQAAGLLMTYVCDRSPARTIFTLACASTAVVCPLVFGFPTEMWIAHAAMWPTLAASHHARNGAAGWLAVLAAFLVLVLSHEGGLILALAIVATTAMHGWTSRVAARAAAAFAVAVIVWLAAQAALPPDAYFAPVFARARQHFFDPQVFTTGIFARVALAIAGLGLSMILLRRLSAVAAAMLSVLVVAGALSVCWLVDPPPLHAENRYYLRTALVLLTPAFAIAAVLLAIPTTNAPPLLARLANVLQRVADSPRLIAFAGAALILTTVIHAVETARFVTAWSAYTAEIRHLVSDPPDAARDAGPFVSSARISPALQPLAWSSTTPFLSVLVAPDLSPSRLVVDPAAGYFWLTCSQSRQNEAVGQTVPKHALALIRDYSCRYRQD